MIYVKESKFVGTTSGGKSLNWIYLEADELADLPAPDVYASDGLEICMGSEAHVIDDNSMHMLKSDGTWIQQVAGTSSYTRAEVDALIAGLHDETFGRGKQIPDGSDINTYKTPGSFYFTGDISTLSNIPSGVTGAFKLLVDELTTVNGSRLRHTIYTVGNATANFFARNLAAVSTTYPTGWRPWNIFQGTNV